MSYEIRPITDDEFPKLARVLNVAFGDTEEDAEHERTTTFEFDRSIGVFEGDRAVGSAGAYSFDLTLPGGTTTPVAGVTWVGVVSTHRRQGILRQMMAHQLADVRERGEALAILTASEAIIYGRFGYGLASLYHSVEVKLPARLAGDVPLGRLALLDKGEAGKVLPGVYERWRTHQPGAVSRRPEWWDMWLLDLERWRKGASGRFYVVHENEPGQPDGYLVYRTKNGWDDNGLPTGEVRVEELVALNPEAKAALWRYCLEVDLMRKVAVSSVAVDDPVRWRFADSRQFRVAGSHDHLWARLLDIPAALAARRYEADDRLVLEVDDGFLPDLSGRYEVAGGPDGAESRPTDAEPDIRLGIADLGAAYLGAISFRELAGAGRAQEVSSGGLRRADAMFRSVPAAYCNTSF